MAYPDSVISFTTKNAGDTVDEDHINDIQAELVNVEGGILNGTGRLNSSNSTLAALSVTGGSTLGTVSAGNSTLSALSVSGGSTLGTVSAGNSTLSALSVSGGSTLGTVSAGNSTLSALSVSGGSTLGTVSAGNSTLSALTVTGTGTQRIGGAGASVLHGNSSVDSEPSYTFQSNRSSTGQSLGSIDWAWSGTAVARIQGIAGADTANKDDGIVRIRVAQGGTLATALTIDQDKSVDFAGDVGCTGTIGSSAARVKTLWVGQLDASSGITVSQAPRVRISNSGNQSLTGGAITATWDTQEYDSDDMSVSSGIQFKASSGIYHVGMTGAYGFSTNFVPDQPHRVSIRIGGDRVASASVLPSVNSSGVASTTVLTHVSLSADVRITDTTAVATIYCEGQNNGECVLQADSTVAPLAFYAHRISTATN